MSKHQKLIDRLMSGSADRNINFHELCDLLRILGFTERVHGDHHIYYRDEVIEILNLQPKGSTAKPYQVKQVRNIINKYRLLADYED